MHDDQKLMNLGIEVKTKKFGTVRVREITFEDVQLFAQELLEVVAGVDWSGLDKERNGVAVFGKIAALPETLRALYTILGPLSVSPMMIL